MPTIRNLCLPVLASISLLTTPAFAEVGPIDANGDGVLDRDEFMVIEEMGASWIVFDADQDGVISQIEFNEEAANLVSNNPNSLDTQEALDLDRLTAAFSNPTDY